jgi:hypothetical protein
MVMTGIYEQQGRQINVFIISRGKAYFHLLPSWELSNEPMAIEQLMHWTWVRQY